MLLHTVNANLPEGVCPLEVVLFPLLICVITDINTLIS